MSYQVLARKWRPQHFSQLVGQEHVKTALGNALSNNRLHHAYLFTGTRGVGKTTIARIFAKSLNCEQGVSATPCGQCAACTEIDAGNFVDLLEIDAASRTKVEDTRDLLDNVQYAPSRGRFKVYLIDEVHMLSRHSFNALLKTLEEPPPHVKFLLATTDPQKLPITVLSRCLQFNLLALSPQQIEQHLSFVLTQEQVPFEASALTLLAKAAKGSLRDSLSLTDQAIAQSNGNIGRETVRSMLGLLDQSWAQQLLQAILAQDISSLQSTLAALVQQQNNISQVLDDILSLLHLTALAQFSPAAAAISEHQQYVLQLADTLAPAQVQLYYQLLISGKKEFPYAPDPLSGLQMALLRAMAFTVDAETSTTRTAPVRPVSTVVSPAQAKTASTDAVTTSVTVDLDTVQSEQPIDTPAMPDHKALQQPDIGNQQLAPLQNSAPETNRQTDVAASAIDPVTARIMARRGVAITELATEKKSERQQAPATSTPRLEVISSLVHEAELQSATQAPILSEATADSHVAVSLVQAESASEPEQTTTFGTANESNYAPDDDVDTSSEPYDSALSEAMWQQYEQEHSAASQSEAELTPFDGSITEENFSVRFAAQVDAWAARVETLDTGGLSRLFLLNAAMQLDGNTLRLTVAQSQQHLDSGNFRQKLQQVLEQSFQQPLDIEISYQAEVAQSPLSIQQHIVQQRFEYVRNLLQQDEKILQLQTLFSAEMLPETIKVN